MQFLELIQKGSDVVALLYRNAARSEAPQAILDEYGVLIDSGATTASQLAMSVAEHSINATNLDLVKLSSERGSSTFFLREMTNNI